MPSTMNQFGLLVLASVIILVPSGLLAQSVKVGTEDELKIDIPVLKEMVTKVLIPQLQHSSHNVKTIRGFQIVDPLEDISVLRIDEVMAELEFVNEQSSKIKTLLTRTDKFKSTFWEKLIGAGSKEKEAELKAWYEIEAKEISDKLDEIVLPHQRKLIQNIGEQLLLRRIGLESYLVRLEQAGELKISKSERINLKKLSDARLQAISEDGKQLTRDSIQELLTALEPAKRDLINIDVFVGDGITSVDALLAQLNYRKGLVRKIKSEYEILERPSIYFPGDDGTPQFYRRGRGTISCDFERLSGYENLLEVMADGRFAEIKLSASQQQDLAQIRLDITAKCLSFDSYLNSASNPWLASENILDMQISLCKRVTTKMDAVLTPLQKDITRTKIAEHSAWKFGLVYELTEGGLNAKLRITDAEVVELKKNALKISKEIRIKTRSWVNDYNLALISKLDRKNRNVIHKRLGNGIEVGGATLFVLTFDTED